MPVNDEQLQDLEMYNEPAEPSDTVTFEDECEPDEPSEPSAAELDAELRDPDGWKMRTPSEDDAEPWLEVPARKIVPLPNTWRALGGTTADWVNGELHETIMAHAGEPVIGTDEHHIVERLTKNLILADAKAWKTTLAMRLTYGMSLGNDFFDALPVPVTPQPVCYIHLELSPRQLVKRTQDATQGLSPSPFFYQERNVDAHLIRPEGQEAIRQSLKEAKKAMGRAPQILVLDPWQELVEGFDENSAQEMAPARKFIDRLISDFNVTVFICFHTGKDKTKGARGTSSIEGWRDTLFELTRTRERLTVKVESRWAEPIEPFTLIFQDGTLWDEGDVPKWTRQEQKIRNFVAACNWPVTRTALLAHLQTAEGMKPEAARKAIKRAEDSHAVTIKDDIVTVPCLGDVLGTLGTL